MMSTLRSGSSRGYAETIERRRAGARQVEDGEITVEVGQRNVPFFIIKSGTVEIVRAGHGWSSIICARTRPVHG